MAEYGQDPIPQPGTDETTTPITIEGVLDKIAEAIITSEYTNINPNLVKQNQKTIRDGIIKVGRNNSETLALFQKDIKANAEDLQSTHGGETLTSIVNTISVFGGTLETTQISISPLDNGAFSIHLYSGDFDFDITNILSEVSINEDGTQTILNPLNISQFINIEQQQTTIDPEQAEEYLDTNIYELLPDSSLRQDQINQLFIDVNNLLPPQTPNFDIDSDGRVDRGPDGTWTGSLQYYYDNSITAPQDNPNQETIDEEEAYVTRLNDNAVGNANNSSKTIESLRNRLNDYLKDVDEQPTPALDDRPVYENQSEGYLKFRNLNQGMIIRNTDSEFIEGLDPNNQSYLETGFTITMWVRFLDKASSGTLFNFGNPIRGENPFGFKLETYVIDGEVAAETTEFGATGDMTWKDIFQNGSSVANTNLDFTGEDGAGTPPTEGFFNTTDTERFVRLVVHNPSEGKTYGSHVGTPFYLKKEDGKSRSMTNTRIPVNFKEWYFICATYNPFIEEDEDLQNRDPDFWKNNINEFGQFVINSELGNKCKVEIISRTDLLRARGYKV